MRSPKHIHQDAAAIPVARDVEGRHPWDPKPIVASTSHRDNVNNSHALPVAGSLQSLGGAPALNQWHAINRK